MPSLTNLQKSQGRRRKRELLNKLSIFKNKRECWIWPGYINSITGYGMYGRENSAHRAVYKLLKGPIPKGLVLDHLCKNRACINPDHLEPVTYRENLRRGNTLATANIKKTECKNGHPYDAKNTYWRQRLGRRPERDCKICKNEATARYKMKKAGYQIG